MNSEFVKVSFYIEANGSKTFFFPECRLKGGYEIGGRDVDKERYIQSYWDALDKAMTSPRFRCPNKNGIPGGVTCQHGDVEEVSRAFLEAARAKVEG
jgi:hypothetical protein